jgi:hypothetical protein
VSDDRIFRAAEMPTVSRSNWTKAMPTSSSECVSGIQTSTCSGTIGDAITVPYLTGAGLCNSFYHREIRP